MVTSSADAEAIDATTNPALTRKTGTLAEEESAGRLGPVH